MYFYWELHEDKPIKAIRFGDWKAVKNGPAAKVELYNLGTDAAESVNVAADHPDLVAKAVKLMNAARVAHPNWPIESRPSPAKTKGEVTPAK